MLTALAGTHTGDVVVEVADGTITVAVGGASSSGPALEHDFPDHRRLLRTDATHRVPVEAVDLRAQLAVAPVRTVRREQDGADRPVAVLTLSPEGGVHVGGGGPGLVEMGLDREFLLQALDAVGTGQLVLELDGPLTPLAVRDARRPEHVTLLMPVALT